MARIPRETNTIWVRRRITVGSESSYVDGPNRRLAKKSVEIKVLVKCGHIFCTFFNC